MKLHLSVILLSMISASYWREVFRRSQSISPVYDLSSCVSCIADSNKKVCNINESSTPISWCDRSSLTCSSRNSTEYECSTDSGILGGARYMYMYHYLKIVYYVQLNLVSVIINMNHSITLTRPRYLQLHLQTLALFANTRLVLWAFP